MAKAKKAAVKKQPRCEATTAAGTRCKRPAAGKAKHCILHKTAASRKTSEKKALAAKTQLLKKLLKRKLQEKKK